ncbi:ABC transporter ATP-binding protein [Salinibacterium sp. M195]|uniref:ABC transporter ATP-binding protein n=1 Tax=Salinibacterium sp. M195 TaxID=2583374 RepID=UPI001C63B59A|nr:ABC transporter ATP-binding protein [Salinibacterium sp. M195]QYH36577.1 ABC transporter ATP-binding protein [Salinibacterium sp. M195]
MTTTTNPVLRIDNLSVAFLTGRELVPAVRNVSIDVAAGETVAVVGESGSGKSTTAAAINRLLPENARITSGSILFEGREMTELPESALVRLRGAGIGLVPQDPMSNLNPLMRIGAQIGEALEVHGIETGPRIHQRAVELLELVGIPDAEQRSRQYPHEFSGGMRQRALIAMGLACQPRLLIADEPTSALDVTVQRRILDQLDELTGRMGTAVFLITHDLALAAERADRIVVMFRGEIVEEGTAHDIFTNPQHDYTKQLLAAAPSLSTRRPLRTVATTAAAVATPLVEIRDLRKVFELRSPKAGEATTFTAVDGVSFTISKGTTVSIVGESGSGKSTTANLVLGLEEISGGSILFDGVDLTTLKRRELFAFRRRVQPVFQNPYASLDPRYTVEQSIIEPLKVHRVGTAASRRERVAELLDQVSLPAAMASRLPHELSGGQRQRVAIARALTLEPELVVLDEAVSALDVLVQAQTLELLAELQERLGLSYLFISHDLAVVRMISDEIHVMQRGRIVESGTPEQIFEHPQDAYTRELLEAIPGSHLSID